MNGDFLLFEKLLIALLLGLTLGFERTIAGKMAGMRTYALMSMGSCLLIIVSQYVSQQYIGLTNFDPIHLAAAIVTGIGFICGGLIIFTDEKIIGLTTAAGMWVAVAIGIAVGFDLYNIAIFATILTLITFTFFFKIELEIRKLSGEGSRD